MDTITTTARARFGLAVQAATQAYKTSGKMLDAALAYAAHGYPVFPLTVDKKPVPRRDPDPSGKFKDGIPGTGGFKKATCDPIQIHAWWRGNEYLIGLPMGARSGVWCLDIDTSEDHADGVAQWNKLIARHGPIVTREHRSATGGPHLIFNWNPVAPIGCSLGGLPKQGSSVKGEGSYIVVPPSQRKGRSYTVHRDIDPIDEPMWLTALIMLHGRIYTSQGPYTGQTSAEFDEVADAMACIPNDDENWEEWKSMALRLYAGLGDEGLDLFDTWSQKSNKYDAFKTDEAWAQVQGCPPNRTGIEKIFSIAREHGWERKGTPTYTQEGLVDADTARREVQRIIDKFLHGVSRGFERRSVWKNLPYLMRNEEPPPPVWAVHVDTGVGKTEYAIEAVSNWLQAEGKGKRVVYTVPRHPLGKKIVEKFIARGINAREFYGRTYADPEHYDHSKSKDQQVLMCLRPKAVAVATAIQADVTKTCCKDGKVLCPLISRCGYYRQQEDHEAVEVWVVASSMMFHAQKALGKPALVVIDEGFWQIGIRGDQQVALSSLDEGMPDVVDYMNDAHVRAQHRHKLAQAPRRQDDNGGVERRHLRGRYIDDCDDAIRREWDYIGVLMERLKLKPGSPVAKRANELIDDIKHSRRVIKIFEEVRNILERDDIEVSGRLTLKQNNGQRVITWRGVDEIKQQFKVPTLILDATLPDEQVLEIYHPQAERVADIKVELPQCVHIRQVLNAPTSASKLIRSPDKLTHRQAVRRYIIARHYETGRKSTLVICQQEVEEWLVESDLPDGITVKHFNDVAGIDDFRNHRLGILVGRVAPGPWEIEALAGALTGRQPQLVAPEKGYTGYPSVARNITLKDGTGLTVDRCDQHPDELAENVRWLINEAELLQGIGRLRAVNRSPDNPCDIDILCNVVLPIIVDEVSYWETPSKLIETVAEGHMLTSPVEMTKLRPDLWANTRAADRTIKRGVPSLPGFAPVKYRLRGPKMKSRVAYFDPTVIPNPREWIERNIGPLCP